MVIVEEIQFAIEMRKGSLSIMLLAFLLVEVWILEFKLLRILFQVMALLMI